MNDVPCKCGHLENVHPSEDGIERIYIVCDGCFKINRPAGIKQLTGIECQKYVPDNLKYLEQIYESRKVSNR